MRAALLAFALLATLPAAAQSIGGLRPFTIPSESMLPTLEPGDWLWTVPVKKKPVARGDVVVFRKPGDGSGAFYVYRVIALGGERVSMTKGVLHIDGDAVSLEDVPDRSLATRYFCPGETVSGDGETLCTLDLWRETLPGGASHEIVMPRDRSLRIMSFPEKLIPEGHLFLLGDNRANAADSRVPTTGPIPTSAIRYRARFTNVFEKTK